MTKSFSNPVKSWVSKQTQETSAMKIKYKHPMKSLSVFLKKMLFLKESPLEPFHGLPPPLKFLCMPEPLHKGSILSEDKEELFTQLQSEKNVYTKRKTKKSRMLLPNLGIYEKSTYGRILLHF